MKFNSSKSLFYTTCVSGKKWKKCFRLLKITAKVFNNNPQNVILRREQTKVKLKIKLNILICELTLCRLEAVHYICLFKVYSFNSMCMCV